MQQRADTSQTHILIEKDARRLRLTSGDGAQRIFPVRLGRNAQADKQREGDHATPLGEYVICAKNPRSRFFLSVCLSYPNADDARRGLACGLIDATEHAQILAALQLGKMPPQHTRLGGEIYIHGHAVGGDIPNEHDWTRGCVAVDNAAMQELYASTVIGTPVRIVK